MSTNARVIRIRNNSLVLLNSNYGIPGTLQEIIDRKETLVLNIDIKTWIKELSKIYFNFDTQKQSISDNHYLLTLLICDVMSVI